MSCLIPFTPTELPPTNVNCDSAATFWIRRRSNSGLRQRLPEGQTAGRVCAHLPCIVWRECAELVEKRPEIRGIIPEVLVRYGEIAEREACADYGVTVPHYSVENSFFGRWRPRNSKYRLGRNIPIVIRVRRRVNRGVHVSNENTGIEQIVDARRTVDGRYVGVVIHAVEIVVRAREIPAQAVVDGQTWPDAP